jgi:anti-sigma B factor antagonist
MTEDIEGRCALRVDRAMDGPAVVVTVVGDVDLNTVALLHTGLRAALAEVAAPAPVVVDLTAVDFLGSVGLSAIVEAHQLASAARTPLRLVATGVAVLRPIELTGLDVDLDLYATVSEALATSSGGDTGTPAVR